MSMTIGRCALTEDPDAGSLRLRGDQMSFSSTIVGTDVDEMKARVQQLRGLMDSDGYTVHPFTWSEDDSHDGFYTDFNVEVSDYAAMLATGACPFSITMRRVAGGFAAPQFECIATTVVATNAHGLPTGTPRGRIGLPSTDLQEASIPRSFAGGTGGSFTGGTVRTTSDGAVRTINPTDQTPFRFVWATSPAYYYEGSARFEQSFGGTYYEMHGEQVRPVTSPWRISNGLVRVTVNSTTISVSHYDGTQWDTAKLWTVGGVTLGLSLLAQPSVRVIENTPECVTVRCVVKFEAAASSSVLDITLRRGCRWASFALISNYTTDWYINASPNEAGTALTGGFRATATDAAGNRYVVGGLAAQSNTLANGRLKLTTAADNFQFVIGSEVGADGSGQNVIDEYAQTIIENHRVVLR